MNIKIISGLLILAVVSLASAFNLTAQTVQTKEEKKAAEIRIKIKEIGSGEAAKVKVTLNNDTTYQGYVGSAADDSFTIVSSSGTTNTVKYLDVRSINGKNGLSEHKLAIGVTVGIIATIGIIFLAFKASGKRL